MSSEVRISNPQTYQPGPSEALTTTSTGTIDAGAGTSSSDSYVATNSRNPGLFPVGSEQGEVLARGVTREGLTQSIREEMNSHSSRYNVGDLQLDQLSNTRLAQLEAQVRGGTVTNSELIAAIDTVQSYFGFSNEEAVLYVTGANYDKLQHFSRGGDLIFDDYSVRGQRNGISESDAAHARAVIMLASVSHRQRGGGGNPSVLENHELPGFDHVIAAMAGNPEGYSSLPARLGVRLFGGDPTTIPGPHANTWGGDLAAVVKTVLERYMWGGARTPEKIDELFETAWSNDMPLSDQQGDVLGPVVAYDPASRNLSQVLSEALDPRGDLRGTDHQRFADTVGLSYDADGNITNREQWIERMQPTVKALAIGLLRKGNITNEHTSRAERGALAEQLTERALDRWVSVVEAGLKQELPEHIGAVQIASSLGLDSARASHINGFASSLLDQAQRYDASGAAQTLQHALASYGASERAYLTWALVEQGTLAPSSAPLVGILSHLGPDNSLAESFNANFERGWITPQNLERMLSPEHALVGTAIDPRYVVENLRGEAGQALRGELAETLLTQIQEGEMPSLFGVGGSEAIGRYGDALVRLTRYDSATTLRAVEYLAERPYALRQLVARTDIDTLRGLQGDIARMQETLNLSPEQRQAIQVVMGDLGRI